MSTIGENIAAFRKQKKMTQEELAEKMSVTAQAVSKWECDSSYPDITVMQSLAKTLGVTVDDILAGERKIPEVKEAPQEKIDRRILFIEVKSEKTSIVTRFPVSVVRKSIDNGTFAELVGEEEHMDVIADMIDSGVVGPIVEMENEKNHISVKVVDYEG